MFENDARLDDIMNIFKPPTPVKDRDKKDNHVTDAGIRYFSKKDFIDGTVQIEFTGQRNPEVLR
jgi:hypothetical protein